MAQLHCYVPDEIEKQVQRRAAQAGLSVSRYLADLVKRDACAATEWPDGWFGLSGSWQGAPLERPPVKAREKRLSLE